MTTPKTADEARAMYREHCARQTTDDLALLIEKIIAHPKSKNGSFLFGLEIARAEIKSRGAA